MTMADAQSFYAALHGSLSTDANARMHSELELKKLENVPGYAPLALQVAVAETDPSLRMSAAICFKNKVRQGWANSISGADKDVIKAQIVAALVQAPSQIRPQFKLALHYMLNHDFPDHWPAYIDQVGHFVQQTSDPNAVHGGLLALQEVVLVFQWKSRKERSPLNHIVRSIFPFLLQIANQLITHDHNEAAELLKIIAKTYHASIHASLSKFHMDKECISAWCSFLSQLILKPIPNGTFDMDASDDEKSQQPWSKAKKWAFHSLNHLHARYGNSKQERFVDEKCYKSFSVMFMADFAPKIMQSYLLFTQQTVQNQSWVAPRIMYLMAQFFADSISHKAMWAMLRPNCQYLVQHLIHPALTLTRHNLEQWEDDPVEYVHSKIDPLYDYKSPASGAISLLTTFATQRRKATFEGIVQYIHQVMVSHATNPSETTALAKDGGLRMLSELASHCLATDSPIKEQMEPFLVNYLFPEFQSPVKFLRARALATLGTFSEIKFTNPEHALISFNAVIRGLTDPELPIRVEAAIALKPIISIEVVRAAMTPHVAEIMRALLELHNQIDMDAVTEVMEAIVEEFAAEVTPFAVDLARQLGNTFIRIMTEAQEGLDSQYVPNDNDDEDGDASYFDVATEKTMAAMSVLKTMQTLVMSVQEADNLVMQLEIAILPSLIYVLDHQIIDLYPDVFEIVDACTFAIKSVSPTMWALFEKFHAVCKTDAADYICEMVPALDNYVSYGKDQFIINPNLQQAMVDMIDICLSSPDLGEADRVCGCQLIESMLLHLSGHIDHLVPHFLARAMAHISPHSFKTIHFKVSAIEIVINAIYYNPLLTLRFLEENGWTAGFFATWMSVVPKMSRVHDKKLGVVALCSILRIPINHLPGAVVQGLPQLMAAMLAYLSSMDKAVENREAEERYFTGMESRSAGDSVSVVSRELDDEEGEEVLNEGEINDEEGDWEDEEDNLMTLARKAREARENGQGDIWDDDDDEELVEEITFETPLDLIDPYITFAAVFTEIQQTNSAVYELLTKGLVAEHQSVVMFALQRAGENQAKAAAVGTCS